MIDLIDQVVFYKGRVWTIYSTSNDGVFAYQGLKPYPTFNYRDDSQRFSTFRKNITYINKNEISVLENGEIEASVKKERREMKKKFTRKKAIDFYVFLTGHSKAFVSKNIVDTYLGFEFAPGSVRYSLWKHERGEKSFLLLFHNMKGSESHVYYDFITFEIDDFEMDHYWDALKEEIIDGYKESIQ